MGNDFDVTVMADGLWAIDEGMVRCFLVAGNERALLIDSCISSGTTLAEVVHGLTDKPVDLVFTHTDPDHTGGQDGFGIPMLHPSEYDYYRIRGNGERKVRPLWEGNVLDLGGIRLEALLLPGHTPGSLALLDRANRRLFIGDTVSDLWIYMFREGRNLQAFIASLRKLQGLTDTFDAVYPCHGYAKLGAEWVTKTRIAVEKLLAGELEGAAPTRELPCKAYRYDGVTLLL
jgi:glyoxylase-like metal-dependent hydrolase (beta-lactamase superfamily II)